MDGVHASPAYMAQPMNLFSTPQEAALVSTLIGMLSYATFNRYEPRSPLPLIILLGLIPFMLSLLLSPSFSKLSSSISTSSGIYFATLATCTLVYRISPWHPLYSYPGPISCKLTKLYVAFRSQRESQHVYFWRLHNIYGDVVRVGPNELSIRSTDAIEPLLGSSGLPKGSFWDGRYPDSAKARSLISIRDVKEHTLRRRPWNRAFNTTAIKDYEPLISNRTSQLVDALATQSKTGTAVNLTRWISYFAYDMMNDFVFGGGSELMRDGDVNNLWHMLESSQKDALLLSHVPWLGQLMFRTPLLAAARKTIMNYSEELARTRQMRKSSYKDLFYYLLNESGTAARPITDFEAHSDGVLAVGAGADTTAMALTNLFYFLIRNPVAYKRLQAEVDSRGEDALSYGVQAEMVYLNAAINETLRLLPPVLSGSVRGTTHESGGRSFGIHYIPPNTTAFVHFYSVHRDPRNFFPNPESFVPERWLPEDVRIALEPALFKHRDRYIHNAHAFLPFSVGPAGCVGKNFAYLEMRMLVCKLIRSFEIRQGEGFDPAAYEADIWDFFTMAVGELPAVLALRE